MLQLPPVFKGPLYIPMSSDLITKLTGSVGITNLWRNLFKYDELTINMRQKEDSEFASILSRVRLGYFNDQDVETLEIRIIPFNSDSVTGRMQEVVERMAKLPDDTACLLPTRHMCKQLNECMLKNLRRREVQLIGVDSVDCPVHLYQKVSKKLVEYTKDSSLTAWLEKLVIIKLGCKIMLRPNIDIGVGLVNGATGIVTSLNKTNIVDSVTIKFDSGKEHVLEKVNSKFQILNKAFVVRHQFPISPAYAITIHKSQGLTLKNILVDLGNSIFACGQAYVAMSRVTSLSGLNLINFDLRCIKALDSAITEYSYLRKTFRPNSMFSHRHKPKGV